MTIDLLKVSDFTRKQEILAVRGLRNLAFGKEEVMIYSVLATGTELDSDGDYIPVWDEDFIKGNRKFFTSKEDAVSYFNELKSQQINEDECPLSVEMWSIVLDAADVWDVTDFSEMMEQLIAADPAEIESEIVYPHYTSIEGGIVLEWCWNKYIGYAREFRELRLGGWKQTTKDLVTGNEEYTNRACCTLVMSAEEVSGMSSEELKLALFNKLLNDSYKWRNKHAVECAIEEFVELI